jgi:putative toxin-antitoxin system antitoxin component (TIGR02293 family)
MTGSTEAAVQSKAGFGARRPPLKRRRDPRGDALAFCVLINLADGWTRIAVVEHGVPVQVVRDLAVAMDVSLNYLSRTLRISRTAMRRKVKRSKPLSTGESDRVVGLARLVGFIAVMVRKTDSPADFDPARWVVNWLEKPLPALGGRRPAEFMSTRSGQTLVDDMLERVTGAAYA